MARIDTETLKRDHPVEAVMDRYGIGLRPSGQSFIGRCPFHPDGGRPNLYVYPASRSWFCYRCLIGGDVISFVQRIEGVGFHEAVARLDGPAPLTLTRRPARRTRDAGRRSIAPGPAERACLAAAVGTYHRRLLRDDTARTYLETRGVDREMAERFQLGYARGDELRDELRRRDLSVEAAKRTGLVDRDGREVMAGRVVVPEIRGGRPIWLIGRSIHTRRGPKYLGLPGPKPLLGWEAASAASAVFVTEGPFDLLTLQRWGYPALALVGTHVRPAALAALRRFGRLYLILDGDEAGRVGTTTLSTALGPRAIPLTVPGVKDVAELATLPHGRAIFADTLVRADLARAA